MAVKKMLKGWLLGLFLAGVLLSGCAGMHNLGAWVNYRSALTNSREGFDAEADASFQRALEKNPALPAVRASYGMTLLKQGDKLRGLELIRQEMAMFPESKIYLQPVIEKYGK